MAFQLLQKKMFTKLKNNKAQNKIKLKNIENFFSKNWMSCKVISIWKILSGIILRYLGTNKDNYIFLNKWSSNSVISSVGHFCNISNSYINSDFILNYNQWGIENKVNINKKIIIQDSCDSILLNNLSFFNNNSKFEFFYS